MDQGVDVAKEDSQERSVIHGPSLVRAIVAAGFLIAAAICWVGSRLVPAVLFSGHFVSNIENIWPTARAWLMVPSLLLFLVGLALALWAMMGDAI